MNRGIIDKALKGEPLTREDNRRLLFVREPEELQYLFKAARMLREQNFGNEVFLYGFLYISTYCGNNCTFCAYHSTNHGIERYRKELAQILAAAETLAEEGVHLIDLTMGEDPFYHSESGFQNFLRIVEEVKQAVSLPVMVSPGVVPEKVLPELRAAGAEWYACYQENFDHNEFARLRPGQDYGRRLEIKNSASRYGLLVEEGLLTGTGESSESLAFSIEEMKKSRASQVRVMEFVPEPNIPLQPAGPDPNREAVIIALLRLNFPDLLIPASLDVEGIGGLEKRLSAGANVVTSIVPAGCGLAGVANKDLDIETGDRSIARVMEVLSRCGLVKAGQESFTKWMRNRCICL